MVLSSKSELLWLFGTWKYWLGRWPESLSAVISVLALIFSDFWPSVVWPLHIFLFLFFSVYHSYQWLLLQKQLMLLQEILSAHFLTLIVLCQLYFLAANIKFQPNFLSQQNNLISCPFVKPLYLSLMRVLVVFYLWVNFVLVKRSPASKFTSQSLTYLVECFVSCCVFPYTFWYIGAGLQILLCATSQHKHHTSSPRIIHLIVLFWA